MTGAAGLRSVSRPLDAEEHAKLRRLAFARGSVIEHDRISIVTFGEACSLRLPNGLTDPHALAAVAAALSDIEPGAIAPARLAGGTARPIAVGALPFLPDAATALTVPAVQVIAAAGAVPVAIVIGNEPSLRAVDALLAEVDEAAAEGDPPDSFRLESQRPHADFLRRVAAAVEEVRSGRIDKVVLAREVRIEANRPLRQGDLLERLRSLHPSCTTFALDGFVGATPELLVRRSGAAVESRPLAGTAPRSGDPEADRRIEAAMLHSEKERAEHRAVVDAIADGLRPAMAELTVPDAPSIVELRNVSHLGTHITGELAHRFGGQVPNALEVLALIHPTPAVAGAPVDLALDYLAKAEDLDRDRYARAVGSIDAAGDGEWHLGIRCALVDGPVARLFAGVGIVADSDPRAELAETQLKLQAFLAAAVRP